MDKADMEKIWNDKVIDPFKINKFKGRKHTCTISIYEKVLVDEFTESGYYNKESEGRFALEKKLGLMKSEKYPWTQYKDLSWSFHHK